MASETKAKKLTASFGNYLLQNEIIKQLNSAAMRSSANL
jgi:hypothetical protein